jgi:hypothetical protein
LSRHDEYLGEVTVGIATKVQVVGLVGDRDGFPSEPFGVRVIAAPGGDLGLDPAGDRLCRCVIAGADLGCLLSGGVRMVEEAPRDDTVTCA